ncbi:MAG: hypothetical protein ACHQF0_04300 [Chitinophagales bacterium]
MKLIPGNIPFVIKSQSSLLFFLFFISKSILGQHLSAHDTTDAPPGDGDSAVMIEQTDTASERTNYFDHTTGYTADTVQLRQVPPDVIDSLKKDDAFWYADKIFREKKAGEKQAKDIKTPSQWMDFTTLVIIVVIFIALLAWYLFQNNIIRRRQGSVHENKEEISEENIFDINYQFEIEKAIDSANYRLATRLLFLRLLKELSQKNIIQYKQERTNFDYLSQLSSGGYYSDFFRLTRNYEYAWYGKFDVSKDAFSIIKKDFENFNQKLP